MSACVALVHKPDKSKGGKAWHYTDEQRHATAKQVCEFIMQGYTRIEACQRAGVSNQTLSEWCTNFPETIGGMYARARAEQAHVIADQAVMIADEPVNSMEGAARNRLRVDTRKWMASKLLPRVYGEKVTQEHTHRVGVVMLPALPSSDGK